MHIAGVGDYFISDISALDDPCPSPQFKALQEAKAAEAEARNIENGVDGDAPKVKPMRRALNAKETLLYAPMSNVGNIMFDKDAMYIRVDDSKTDETAEGVGMVKTLQNVQENDNVGFEQLEEAAMPLFANSKPLTSADLTDKAENQVSDKNSSSDSDSSDDDDDSNAKWKRDIDKRAARAFADRQKNNLDFMDLIYGNKGELDNDEGESSSNADDSDDDFFTIRKDRGSASAEVSKDSSQNAEESNNSKLIEVGTAVNLDDCSKVLSKSKASVQDWNSLEVKESIRNRFVTGEWKDSANAGNAAGSDSDDDSDGEGFEDLETGEVFTNEGQVKASKNLDNSSSDGSDSSSDSDSSDSDGDSNDDGASLRSDPSGPPSGKSGKHEGNSSSDEEDIDPERAKELEQKAALERLSKTEFTKNSDIKHTGIAAGRYVRIELNGLPAEFVTNFQPEIPVLVGGLLPHEISLGYSRIRIKKHRWYKRLLKTNDPLIFSAAWRRFQSIPIYATEDVNGRHRMLKYTPRAYALLGQFLCTQYSTKYGCSCFSISRS